ncbi:MAG: Cysteine desulfuration protein SufE [Chlamydiae bacterium]|nr:Cysteine desulfuration protein SufE [Chlamydiota bacterium]
MNQEFFSCLQKQREMKEWLLKSQSPQESYQKIIALGQELPPIAPEYKCEENIVRGCQSIVYLHSELHEKHLKFTAYSEALISRGLAALLISLYDNEPPEALLKCKPDFLEEVGIYASLSPGRSNGLASMYLRMQKDALNFLVAL